LENDLPAITNMYESGWQKLTQVSHPSTVVSYEGGADISNTTNQVNGLIQSSFPSWFRMVSGFISLPDAQGLISRPSLLDSLPRSEYNDRQLVVKS
jgi:hypothetical protein